MQGNSRYPETPDELQEAADAAVFSLGLDSAWQYGFITPDPQVDVARCEEIIADAHAHGLTIHTLEEILPGPDWKPYAGDVPEVGPGL